MATWPKIKVGFVKIWELLLPRSRSSRERFLNWLYKKLYESVISNVGLLIKCIIQPFKCLWKKKIIIWNILKTNKLRDCINVTTFLWDDYSRLNRWFLLRHLLVSSIWYRRSCDHPGVQWFANLDLCLLNLLSASILPAGFYRMYCRCRPSRKAQNFPIAALT